MPNRHSDWCKSSVNNVQGSHTSCSDCDHGCSRRAWNKQLLGQVYTPKEGSDPLKSAGHPVPGQLAGAVLARLIPRHVPYLKDVCFLAFGSDGGRRDAGSPAQLKEHQYQPETVRHRQTATFQGYRLN